MSTAAEYHERTKHSPASVRSNRHMLDWAIQPLPFKIYEDLAPIPLPRDLGVSSVPALQAIASAADGSVATPDLRQLARLLYFSAGVTKRKEYPGGQVMYFRAAACTGALYHIDVYAVCGELPGLAAGVYHYGPQDNALRQLRAGDFRAALVDASAAEPAVAAAPAILVCTSTFWRNAWKYQARTYRHCFWDAGTLLANLFAVAAADAVPARVVVGFVDATVNALLGLDVAREVSLALVPLGRGASAPPPAPAMAPLQLATRPLSEREVDYPLIRAAHAATSLADAAAVRGWREREQKLPALSVRPGAGAPIPLPAPATSSRTIEDVIRRRGSARRFARTPIELAALSAMLRAASGSVAFDDGRNGLAMAEAYLIVNAVSELAAGTYALTQPPALTPLTGGDFRKVAGHLDLGQELAADAAVDVYLLADLPRLLAAGDRSYRAAQLAGAIAGGKLYLAAYALGLGATGLTFFDDDVIEFFSPHAADKDVMFLVAAGTPQPRL